MKKIIFFFISFLDKVIPKNNKQIIYASFPDFSDNSFALFIYILNNHPEYKNIWLVDNIEKINLFVNMINNYSDKENKNYKIIKKKSLLGFYFYMRSRYIFFTHGLYNDVTFSPKHIVVNLWHGMPLKNIGYLDTNFKGTVPKSTYAIATSELYQDLISKAFELDKDKVLISGQPRNDLLKNDDKTILKKFLIPATSKKVFMWMPTYRKSILGDIRTDGMEQEGFPVLTLDDLKDVNQVLKEKDYYLIIKLHPMDSLTLFEFPKYSHIKIIQNDDFEQNGIQLYSLLGVIDVLLTDYSSVYIDFLLTGKPIAFVMSDFGEYFNSRGFVFEKPLDYMPGDILATKREFIEFIKFSNKSSKYDTVRESLVEDINNSSYIINNFFEQ